MLVYEGMYLNEEASLSVRPLGLSERGVLAACRTEDSEQFLDV